MVTDKAKELSKTARTLAELARKRSTVANHGKAAAAADDFFAELFENCCPTEDEFAALARGVVCTARALWGLALNVPGWALYHDLDEAEEDDSLLKVAEIGGDEDDVLPFSDPPERDEDGLPDYEGGNDFPDEEGDADIGIPDYEAGKEWY